MINNIKIVYLNYSLKHINKIINKLDKYLLIYQMKIMNILLNKDINQYQIEILGVKDKSYRH